VLPPGSQRDLVDPFAEKKSPWPKIILVLVILAVLGGCWYLGKLDKILPPGVRSTSVLGTNAPAWQPPPVTSATAGPSPPVGANAAPAAAPKH